MFDGSPPHFEFSALLLAGGRSRRMGSDKAFMMWDGAPLWRVQLAKLHLLGAVDVKIACRVEQAFPPDAGAFVYDPAGEDLGPMPAIARTLTLEKRPLVVLAVDMPLMSPDFLRKRLLKPANVARSRFFSSAQGLEPLAGLYHPNLLGEMDQAISSHNLSLTSLISKAQGQSLVDVVKLAAEEQTLFQNWNTLADWGT